MSNSSLATYKKISPNRTTPRNHVIDTISIHCAVGQVTAKQLINMDHIDTSATDTDVSCNYAVGYDGSIALCVEEKDRSWCTSSRSNDHRAVTIEVASEKKHPYKVTAKAYKALVELVTDICKRNGIKQLLWKGDKSLIGQVDKQNMTVHRWFANKACPGDYLYNLHGQIAKEVNAKLAKTDVAAKPPVINVSKDAIHRVQTGAFKNEANADGMIAKLKAAGFKDAIKVKASGLFKVQVGAYKKEANAENMVKKLKAAGFDTTITTTGGEVVPVSTKKSIEVIAKEVIAGKWGVGTARKTALKKAGYTDAEITAIQKRVNELL